MGKAPGHDDAPPGGVSDATAGAASDLFHLIATVSRFRDVRLDRALKPLGLNVTRYQALSVIARLAPCTMSELADLSAIDRTTLTRIVDQLVARGLAERSACSEDRRQVVLSLTGGGRDVCRDALTVIEQIDRAALQGLAPDALAAAARTHRALAANLSPDPRSARRLLDFRPD